jgi:hypothetical protein
MRQRVAAEILNLRGFFDVRSTRKAWTTVHAELTTVLELDVELLKGFRDMLKTLRNFIQDAGTWVR